MNNIYLFINKHIRRTHNIPFVGNVVTGGGGVKRKVVIITLQKNSHVRWRKSISASGDNVAFRSHYVPAGSHSLARDAVPGRTDVITDFRYGCRTLVAYKFHHTFHHCITHNTCGVCVVRTQTINPSKGRHCSRDRVGP